MKLEWNTEYIDPKNLILISNGDSAKMVRYLRQFLELMPPRIQRLQDSLESEDRKMICQILHQMSPQLQFFGIPDVVIPIRRLEFEYESMPLQDLISIVNELLLKLDGASKEVAIMLDKMVT